MRNDLLAAALGFLVGMAALAGGEEDDRELTKQLQDLQEAIGEQLVSDGIIDEIELTLTVIRVTELDPLVPPTQTPGPSPTPAPTAVPNVTPGS